MKPQYNNRSTATKSILPNIPARPSDFSPSDPLLPNQTHPAPVNQGWILLNMARTHIEANFKLSPRIRYHRKREPGPAEKITAAAAAANVTPLSTK